MVCVKELVTHDLKWEFFHFVEYNVWCPSAWQIPFRNVLLILQLLHLSLQHYFSENLVQHYILSSLSLHMAELHEKPYENYQTSKSLILVEMPFSTSGSTKDFTVSLSNDSKFKSGKSLKNFFCPPASLINAYEMAWCLANAANARLQKFCKKYVLKKCLKHMKVFKSQRF